MLENINLANIVQILSILGFGGAILVTMKNNLSNLKEDVVDLRKDIKLLNEVLITMAVTDTRLSNLESDVRELRHGRGFVVDGEYPRIKP
jgi:hypothetical protein